MYRQPPGVASLDAEGDVRSLAFSDARFADIRRSLARDGKAIVTRVVYSSIPQEKRRASVPLYEYKCLKCGRKTERIENVSGPYLKRCPHCGGKVEGLISAPSIQFKGSGWYVTDYASKKPSSEGGKEEKAAAESKDSTKDSAAKDSGSKDSTKDSGSKEKKADKSDKSAKRK
jgi:putative FmdB family regulatory protein